MKIYYIRNGNGHYFRNPIFQLDFDAWTSNKNLATAFVDKHEAKLVRNFLEKVDFLDEMCSEFLNIHNLKIVSRKVK